jgi:RND family efflux transporter MFP subunit
MESKNVDLLSLRIDRSSRGMGSSRKLRRLRTALLWSMLTVILAGGVWFFKDSFYPGIEVQLVSASLTSRAQASSVLTASGYVVARRKAAVASKGTGRLVFLGVEEGDKVKKGQVIARLEDEDVLAAMRRALADLRASEAELKDAKESLERQKILLKKEFVSQAEFDAAEARYYKVVASIDAAKAAVKESEVAVENTRIIAPFDGTVIRKNADVGEIVAPLAGAASSRAAVVTIADMSSLEVDADVSEANITRVSTDQNCLITLDAYPQQQYLGYVSKIVPTADRAKATVLVKIKFRKYDHKVLPEMSAKVSFLEAGARADGAETKPLLTVPAAAVAHRNGRPVVFQIRDERAVEVPVVTGQKIGGLLEIKSGLREGDKVIGQVGEQIHTGAKVALKGK